MRPMVVVLVALALALPLVGLALAEEYPAGAFGDRDGWIKEARQTRLYYMEGTIVPGTFVKQHREARWAQWHYLRGRWWVIFKFWYPPDELRHDGTVVVPMTMRIVREGDDPLRLVGTADLAGVRGQRVKIEPATLIKKNPGSTPEIAAGRVTFRPRLDWDDQELVLTFRYGDGQGTHWQVGEFHFWSTIQERPKRRPRPDRDIARPVFR